MNVFLQYIVIVVLWTVIECTFRFVLSGGGNVDGSAAFSGGIVYGAIFLLVWRLVRKKQPEDPRGSRAAAARRSASRRARD
jgi:hypothetical protein